MTNINNNSTIPHQFNKTTQCQCWWDGVAMGYRKWWKQLEEETTRRKWK